MGTCVRNYDWQGWFRCLSHILTPIILFQNFPSTENTESIVYVMVCWQAPGAYQLLSLHCHPFQIEFWSFLSNHLHHEVYQRSLSDKWISFLLKKWCSGGRDPSFTLLHFLRAAAVVATAFTPVVVPIPTSAAVVTSSEVAAAVAGSAADILAAAVVCGAAAAVV